jgi:hypothetical protein
MASIATINVIGMRVGNINENFKNSVLDRISIDSRQFPIWGYNSDTCCGLPTVSNSRHKLLLKSIHDNTCYVLFLPNNKSGIIGLAKIKGISKRELGPLIPISSTNEDNGWTQKGLNNWDYEMIIDKYWDLTKLFDANVFSYDKLFVEKNTKISQSSIHKMEDYPELYTYLHPHCLYIINNLKPSYKS